MERWELGRMDRRMEAWKDGRMEGWKDGRMDRRTAVLKNEKARQGKEKMTDKSIIEQININPFCMIFNSIRI